MEVLSVSSLNINGGRKKPASVAEMVQQKKNRTSDINDEMEWMWWRVSSGFSAGVNIPHTEEILECRLVLVKAQCLLFKCFKCLSSKYWAWENAFYLLSWVYSIMRMMDSDIGGDLNCRVDITTEEPQRNHTCSRLYFKRINLIPSSRLHRQSVSSVFF